ATPKMRERFLLFPSRVTRLTNSAVIHPLMSRLFAIPKMARFVSVICICESKFAGGHLEPRQFQFYAQDASGDAWHDEQAHPPLEERKISLDDFVEFQSGRSSIYSEGRPTGPPEDLQWDQTIVPLEERRLLDTGNQF